MDFELSEEQTLLRETARRFAGECLRANDRAHEAEGLSDAVREAFDGTGLSLLWSVRRDDEIHESPARCLIAEALGHGDAGAALALLMPTVCAGLAQALGVPDAARQGLSFVAVEPYETHQTIEWLPMAPADRLLLFDASGRWRVVRCACEPVNALGLQGAGGCRVRVEATLESGNCDAAVCGAALAELRALVGSLLIGLADAALEYVRPYVSERQTFGRPLAQHQGVAFMVADMAIHTAGARVALHAAALGLDDGDERGSARVARAYRECCEAALHCTNQGVQLLGGHGYMKDHPVEKWMRDARSLALLFGGADAALADAAAREGEEAEWT